MTVSSLFSGHRLFARAGVVSAHIYGHAVDIAAIGGASIAGNQRPGGLTEAAVRSILLLPADAPAAAGDLAARSRRPVVPARRPRRITSTLATECRHPRPFGRTRRRASAVSSRSVRSGGCGACSAGEAFRAARESCSSRRPRSTPSSCASRSTSSSSTRSASLSGSRVASGPGVQPAGAAPMPRSSSRAARAPPSASDRRQARSSMIAPFRRLAGTRALHDHGHSRERLPARHEGQRRDLRPSAETT